MRLDASAPARRGLNLVGIPRRSRYSDVDEGRAIAQAMFAARGHRRPCPVIHGARIVGFVRGEGPFSPRVAFEKVPAQYRMAWQDYNDVIASLADSKRLSRMWSKQTTTITQFGTWFDLWPVTGFPTAGSLAGAANTANAYDNTSPGTLYMGPAVAPEIRTLTSTWAGQTSIGAPTIMVYDRVLDYQANAYTAAASQAMTNVAVAARYNGAGLPGLEIVWAAQTLHNATASNITVVTYVDNTGAAALMPTSSTVSIIVNAVAPTTTLGARVIAPATGGIVYGAFLPLANGTDGARAVTDYTTSAANTGTFYLALVHPLAYVPAILTGGVPNDIDQIFQVAAMERLYDGAAVCAMILTGNNNPGVVTGVVDAAYG